MHVGRAAGKVLVDVALSVRHTRYALCRHQDLTRARRPVNPALQFFLPGLSRASRPYLATLAITHIGVDQTNDPARFGISGQNARATAARASHHPFPTGPYPFAFARRPPNASSLVSWITTTSRPPAKRGRVGERSKPGWGTPSSLMLGASPSPQPSPRKRGEGAHRSPPRDERHRRILRFDGQTGRAARPRTRGQCAARPRPGPIGSDGQRQHRPRPRADAHDARGPVRPPAVARRERGDDHGRSAARQSRRHARPDRRDAAGRDGLAGFARAADRLGEIRRRRCGRCCAVRSRSRSGTRAAAR